MYFWKTAQLANAIKTDTITGQDRKNYYLGTSIITLSVMYLAIIGGTDNIKITLIEGLLSLAIMVAGIHWTFKTNPGKDYIERVILLSFPIFIKIYTFAFLAGIAIGIFYASGQPETDHRTSWLTLALGIAIQVIYFWRLNKHLQTINA